MNGVRRLAELERDSEGGVSHSGESWTILRMILWSAEYLTEKGVEAGRLDAEWLLSAALGVDRLQLYLQYDRPLSSEEAGCLQAASPSPRQPGAATVHHRSRGLSATRVEDGPSGPDPPSRDGSAGPRGIGLGVGWGRKRRAGVGYGDRDGCRGAFARRGGSMDQSRRYRRFARSSFRGGRQCGTPRLERTCRVPGGLAVRAVGGGGTIRHHRVESAVHSEGRKGGAPARGSRLGASRGPICGGGTAWT